MTEALKSTAVTNLDATPQIYMSAGEGAAGYLLSQSDYVGTTAATAVGSTYRLARIPTTAKVKHVWAYLKGMDTNATATWTGAFNIAFSDDTNDGTPPSLQATIPTSANNGTTTTVASYSSPNQLFGTVVAGNSGALVYKEITWNGTFTPANSNDDMWDVFGFVNNQGYAADPGGMFDILVYVTVGAATAAAGTIWVDVDYVK